MLTTLRRRRRVKAFIRDWTTYRDQVLQAAAAGALDTDAGLLAMRGRLAAELQVISAWTPPAFAAEARLTYRRITTLLGGGAQGRPGAAVASFDATAFSGDWHEAYLSLSKLQGALTAPRRGSARPPATDFAAWGGREGRRRALGRLGGPWYGLLVLVFVVAAVALIGLGIGARWDAQAGRFVAREGTAISGALTTALDAVQSGWRVAAAFLDPVTATYGIGWTIGLLALLALALTWWFVAKA